MGIEIVKASVEHALYRFFGEDGALLYVGISADPFKRMAQHRGDKSWWSEVAQVTIERHPSRSAALLAEGAAIRGEGPRYNIARPPEPKPRVQCRYTYFEPLIGQQVTVPNVAPVGADPVQCYQCGGLWYPSQFSEFPNGDVLCIARCRACSLQLFRQDPPSCRRLELRGGAA